VQRLAIDKGTSEWYKRRISSGIKSLILLDLLNADDSPPLGTNALTDILPRSDTTFETEKVLQHTLHEWIEVQIVGRSALARQR
jgi:hypothetical protein